MPDEPIRLTMQIYKIQTLVDAGYRATFDMDGGQVKQAQQLMEWYQRGGNVIVTIRLEVERG